MDKLVLDKAFYPKSIAIVGASNNPTKLGYNIVKAVIRGGFKGKVYPVNIRGGVISGLKAYRTVLEIPEDPDLALIAIPSKLVPKAVRECGERQVGVALIFSAGFGETEEGENLERKLIEVASKYDVRIIGPNTNGLLNLNTHLNATFSPRIRYKEGNVAFVCQSGGYSSLLLRQGSREGVGFSKVVNLGNSCDISFGEVLEYLGTDRFTQVIVLYMEGFTRKGEGRRFYEAAKRVTKTKPIIAFKVGRTEAGRRAVRSHTGSLAGSDRLYDAAFRQAGVIRAMDGVEMIDIAKALSLKQNLPEGKRVGILTNLGGPGVVAADVCESNGLILCELTEETKQRLGKTLSTTASFSNPIDLAADWPHLHLYRQVLSTLLEDAKVDSILMVTYVTPQSDSEALIKDIIAVSKRYNKPIFICCLSLDDTRRQKCIDELEKHSLPCYKIPERTAKALGGVVQYATHKKNA